VIKKYVILFIGIVLVLVIFQFYSIKENEDVINGTEVTGSNICGNFSVPELKIICNAISAQDPFLCTQTGNFEDYCYESVFSTSKNLSEGLCNKFYQYYPRSVCYLNLAKLKRNPSYCEETGGMYQQCSWELAKVMKKPELCSNIEVDCEKYQCVAEVMENSSYCEMVPDIPERKLCYTKLLENATVDNCKEYVPEIPTVLYLPDCIRYLAERDNNITLCNFIENKELKWKCFATVSDTISICNSSADNFWKEFCEIEFIKAHGL